MKKLIKPGNLILILMEKLSKITTDEWMIIIFGIIVIIISFGYMIMHL